MEPTPDAILTQLRKGVVDYCVLACMVAGPVYGLEIAQKLGGGRVLLTSEGTLYPLLSRLRKQGWVATSLQPSPVGPPRRYYELTKAGQAALEEFRTQWSPLRGRRIRYARGIRMINNELPPIAEAYLADLERALAGVEPRERAETVAAVRDHIVDELSLGGAGTVDERAAAAVASLGSVDAIAASASPAATTAEQTAPTGPSIVSGPVNATLIGSDAAVEIAPASAPSPAVAAPFVPAATSRKNWLPWIIALLSLLAIPLMIWQPWHSSTGEGGGQTVAQTPDAATPTAAATPEWLTHADAAGRAAQGALHAHPGSTVIKIEPEGPTAFTVLVRTATGNGVEVYIDSTTGEHIFEHPEELPAVAGGSGPAVTALEAIDTVLRERPGSRVVSVDLASEAGSAVWTVIAADATGQRNIYVDATSGNISRRELVE